MPTISPRRRPEAGAAGRPGRNRSGDLTFHPHNGAPPAPRDKGVFVMLWSLIVILLILWLLGFSFSVGGGLIHLLLVVALVVLLFQLFTGRRAV